MGYGGLLASIRKFNTNDYWKLRRLEAGLPYETALYSPKIMAMAIVANNCTVFDCDKVVRDAPASFGDNQADAVSVAPGVTLDQVAESIGHKPEKIAALNPHMIGSRFPPLQQSTLPRSAWTVYVPKGQGKKAAEELPKKGASLNLATHRVRWGETIDTVATVFGTSKGWLEALNDLHARESPRPGTVVFVPSGRNAKSVADIAKSLSVVAVVPKQKFDFQDKRRVFYEPVFGDTVEEVARVTGVTATEVRRWNHLGARARLQEGMRLQLFIDKDAQPSDVVLFEAKDVQVLTASTEPFFEHYLKPRGKKRMVVVAKAGETLSELGKRFGVSSRDLERINRKNRRAKLKAGDRVVLYVKEP
jgi:membrane-bound lytic murein transglycosylase D